MINPYDRLQQNNPEMADSRRLARIEAALSLARAEAAEIQGRATLDGPDYRTFYNRLTGRKGHTPHPAYGLLEASTTSGPFSPAVTLVSALMSELSLAAVGDPDPPRIQALLNKLFRVLDPSPEQRELFVDALSMGDLLGPGRHGIPQIEGIPAHPFPTDVAVGTIYSADNGTEWELVQARNPDGTFATDDPSTPENESTMWIQVG